MDADGEALTQKKLPKLATIRPSIDLQKGSIRSMKSSGAERSDF